MMHPVAKPACAAEILALRTRHREEMNFQIVHDSIHRRDGWTLSYLLEEQGVPAGFGSVAIGGPWKDKPTVFEFYLLPEYRARAFEFFEVLLKAGRPAFFEIQTNEELALCMILNYGREMSSEKIVFQDKLTTTLEVEGASLRPLTAEDEVRVCLEQRQGGGQWVIDLNGTEAGKGGILFHYNRPYGDIYMEIAEAYRRRGLGSYLVQELKRECYRLGAVPCARCNPSNVASRRTLQRAGFVPVAHILIGSVDLQRLEVPV